MIRLRFFGSVELDRNGETLGRVLAQPKRLALLAYLAIAPDTFHRRDSLLALFWPELGEARARAALNQALRFLRRELEGTDGSVIVSRGPAEVGIVGDAISCDAAAFDRFIERRRWAEALQLYRGNLLPGFHIDDASAFEEWLERMRGSYVDRAANAARVLATEHAEKANYLEGLRAARLALELKPFDEPLLGTVLRFHMRVGDRAGALREYEQFSRRLEAELGATPSRETRRIVDEVRLPPGRAERPDPTARPTAPAATPTPPDSSRSGTLRRLALPFGGLMAGMLAWTVSAAIGVDEVGDRIAVLPFRVHAVDSAYQMLGEGMVDLMYARFPDHRSAAMVDPRAVITAHRRIRGGADTNATLQESLRIARRLGAGRAVVGEMVATGGATFIAARLMDVRTGRLLASLSRRDSGNHIASAIRLADAMVATILGESETRLHALSTDTDAMKAYLTGMRLYRDGRLPPAFDAFGRALELDSTFAPAALWRAYVGWGAFVFGSPVKRRADSVAWSLRARLRRGDSLVLAALPSIGPNYPDASTTAELLAAQERATRSNPDRPEVWYDWARHLYAFGRQASVENHLQLAAYAADSAIALDSTFVPAINHRLYMAVLLRDKPAIHKYLRVLNAFDTSAHSFRWAAARVLGDSVTTENRFARMVRVPATGISSRNLELWSAYYGIASTADAELLAQMRLLQPDITTDEREYLRLSRFRIAALRGQRERALRIADSLDGWALLRLAIAENGYDEAARRVASAAGSRVVVPRGPLDGPARSCDLHVWRVVKGDTSHARAGIAELRAAAAAPDGAPGWRVGRLGLCPLLLEAGLAQSTPADSSRALERLSELLSRGTLTEWPGNVAYLLAARWLSSRREHRRALEVIRRRDPMSVQIIHPAAWRLEGQLALAVGDTAGAIRAYRRYVEIRDQPDTEDLKNERTWLLSTLQQLDASQRAP